MTAPVQGGPALPQIEDPGAIGGVRPRIADLRNRTVVVQPVSIARNVPGVQPGSTQDRITANMFVLDGGPLEFGGKPEKYVPHTLVVPTPYLAEGIYISQVNMVAALLGALPGPQKPQGGLVVGVIAQGKASKAEHNPPWNLMLLEPNDPRRGLASHLLQQFFTGQFVNPEPQQTGAPTPPGGALAYTHAATMPHDPQTGQPIPNLAEFARPVAQLQDSIQQGYSRMQAQQYAAPTQVTYVPPQPAPQAAAPAQDPQYLAWLASQQQQAPAAPVSAAPTPGPLPGGFYGATSAPTPAAPAADVPPAGWAPEMWAQMTEAQRSQIRAASAAATAPASPGPYNGTPPF